MHAPRPVTGDRLRTRVLGSAERDARPKTLFNLVTTARRALGPDRSGNLLLPPATAGAYRLSPSVTVDATEAVGLCELADRAGTGGEAASALRSALALVEGEMLSGVRTGYGWWYLEGHESRVTTALVHAACRLSELAAFSGDWDVASWGLEKAHSLEPDSEALARACMLIAERRGDADGLRRAWRDLNRRLALQGSAPDAVPSRGTEQLYRRLALRLQAGSRRDEALDPAATHAGGPPAAHGGLAAVDQASFAAIDAAPRSTLPSAPVTL